MNWKSWLHGLGAGVISAFASAVPLVIVEPTHFNFTGAGLIELVKVCGASAILAAALYLKASPLPND